MRHTCTHSLGARDASTEYRCARDQQGIPQCHYLKFLLCQENSNRTTITAMNISKGSQVLRRECCKVRGYFWTFFVEIELNGWLCFDGVDSKIELLSRQKHKRNVLALRVLLFTFVKAKTVMLFLLIFLKSLQGTFFTAESNRHVLQKIWKVFLLCESKESVKII